jgi:GNAT superfamily N-acetyltransferase
VDFGIRQADEDDLEAVVETISLAFLSDPVWAWAFPDPDARLSQYRRWWRPFVRSAIAHGRVSTTDHVEAVAIWVVPGGTELLAEDAAALPALIDEVAGTDAGRVLATMELIERNHPVDVPEHFYLTLLGTHPDHRGHGIGLQVLAHDLAQIDEQQAAAYLESSNPANDNRYASVGFARYGQFQLPDDGPVVTTMWRDPTRTSGG